MFGHRKSGAVLTWRMRKQSGFVTILSELNICYWDCCKWKAVRFRRVFGEWESIADRCQRALKKLSAPAGNLPPVKRFRARLAPGKPCRSRFRKPKGGGLNEQVRSIFFWD